MNDWMSAIYEAVGSVALMLGLYGGLYLIIDHYTKGK